MSFPRLLRRAFWLRIKTLPKLFHQVVFIMVADLYLVFLANFLNEEKRDLHCSFIYYFDALAKRWEIEVPDWLY